MLYTNHGEEFYYLTSQENKMRENCTVDWKFVKFKQVFLKSSMEWRTSQNKELSKLQNKVN